MVGSHGVARHAFPSPWHPRIRSPLRCLNLRPPIARRSSVSHHRRRVSRETPQSPPSSSSRSMRSLERAIRMPRKNAASLWPAASLNSARVADASAETATGGVAVAGGLRRPSQGAAPRRFHEPRSPMQHIRLTIAVRRLPGQATEVRRAPPAEPIKDAGRAFARECVSPKQSREWRFSGNHPAVCAVTEVEDCHRPPHQPWRAASTVSATPTSGASPESRARPQDRLHRHSWRAACGTACDALRWCPHSPRWLGVVRAVIHRKRDVHHRRQGLPRTRFT
jgi:hypothetical protein